jgi:hypothetical protein
MIMIRKFICNKKVVMTAVVLFVLASSCSIEDPGFDPSDANGAPNANTEEGPSEIIGRITAIYSYQ